MLTPSVWRSTPVAVVPNMVSGEERGLAPSTTQIAAAIFRDAGNGFRGFTHQIVHAEGVRALIGQARVQCLSSLRDDGLFFHQFCGEKTLCCKQLGPDGGYRSKRCVVLVGKAYAGG